MQLVEISWSVPVVISYRTARMVTGGWPPSARDRRELTRMVQEMRLSVRPPWRR